MSKKRKIVLSVLLVLLLIILVSFVAERYKNKRRNDFIKAAENHYEKHMKGVNGVNNHIVTLDMLQKANDKNFSIKSLKKCDKNSSVTFIIKNKKVTNKKIKLNCK
ncbi:MAG TPA: hypothetical protein PLV83_04165 [Bacilli bacterium]|nr:hypothetical protein [Bacilli bacterium]